MLGEAVHDYAMTETTPSRFTAPGAVTMTVDELRSRSAQRTATAGERAEEEIERLLSVVMDPADARRFAAATSDRGILTAAAGERGDAPPSGRFTPDERARAAEMQHEIRAMAELGEMVLRHETSFDRTYREAIQALRQDPRHERAQRQADYEAAHPLAQIMTPSARVDIHKAANDTWYRKDQFSNGMDQSKVPIGGQKPSSAAIRDPKKKTFGESMPKPSLSGTTTCYKALRSRCGTDGMRTS